MLVRLAALAALGSVAVSQDIPPRPDVFWFKQHLDHFNAQDTRTFQNKYLVYDKFWTGGDAPIFFYAGNEGPIEAFYDNTGFMFDIAPQFGALILFAEHRYYGDSLPFGRDSFERESLRYLSMELAVADFARLLVDFKKKKGLAFSPVVAFGGSYGGVLAAACRIHYPHIFTAALAASAPVPQILNLIDPYLFFKLVTKDFEDVDRRCPDIVRQGYAQIIAEGKKGARGYKTLTDTFNLCYPLESDYDVEYLQLWARNGFLTMAMVDYPYAADFLGSLPPWPVNASCELMKRNSFNPMKAIAVGAGLFYNASSNYQKTCFDIKEEFVLCADQTGCGTGDEARAWDYQMCTQITYGQDTNGITDMFPPRIWELQNLTDYCQKKYQVSPEPDWMQIWFPGDVSVTTQVIWSNGLLDPWHGGGYLVPPGIEQPTVVIAPGAHHLDLRGANPEDPSEVIQARKDEVKYIKTWLNRYYEQLRDDSQKPDAKFEAKKFR